MLTLSEIKVIETYMEDDYVNDYGWDDDKAEAWVKGFHIDCGMSGKEFSGVMSSLVKKGIIVTNGESFSLSEKGIKYVKKELICIK